MTTFARTSNPISERQHDFITKLMREREWTDIAQPTNAAEASDLIGALLKLPYKSKAPAQVDAQAVDDGMYRTPDGTIYKAQYNKASGDGRRLYAKRLCVEGSVDDLDNVRVTFVYESGAIKRLTKDMRMTLDEAKAFGALYGTCCVCGRTLTDEGSIAAGIGPVCASKWF